MKLEIKNVNKSYGNIKALNDFTVCFQEGIYGILGPNGAGKSTLINLLTDNIKRESGEIQYNGVEVLKMGKEYRRLVGYMPQQQVCYHQLTAIDFLVYMAALKGLNTKDPMVRNQIEDILKELNLYQVRNRKIGGFSGGMKRRVILAQALLGDPKILILDEPTAGLDPKERISLRNIIAKTSKNKIVLIATHIVSDIECLADSVLLMKEGKVIKCQSPEELILGVEGFVSEVDCSRDELEEYQRNYKISSVTQRKDRITIRIVGSDLPQSNQNCDINLDDVYIYYFEC